MRAITTSMNRFMEERSGLKYLFFGGKGGVGKTVMAGAAALWSAKAGKKTLLASMNPAHSLSSLFGQDVFGKPVTVCGDPRCHALEIDTRGFIEQSKEEVRERINWFLKSADITTKAEDFVESAAMSPAFEESAMFDAMADLMVEDEYDLYVFDLAPAAFARRLLGMAKAHSLWAEKMLKSREEAKSLRQMLSFSRKKEKDPLMDYLLGFRDRVANVQRLLIDEALTTLFFVTLPESLPIAVTARSINWSREIGIPLGGVIVNKVIQKGQINEHTAEFVRNRIVAQDEHMAEIWDMFGGLVRAITPLLETDVSSAAMLDRMARHLFAPTGVL